jgi:hypothetical protein
MAMKIPSANGGYDELKTKQEVFNAVCPIILVRFQLVHTMPLRDFF